MKKYFLIPVFFIVALATANAGCGSCESHGGAEEKASCCKSDCKTSKCDKEKSDKASCDKAGSKSKSCCPEEKAAEE